MPGCRVLVRLGAVRPCPVCLDIVARESTLATIDATRRESRWARRFVMATSDGYRTSALWYLTMIPGESEVIHLSGRWLSSRSLSTCVYMMLGMTARTRAQSTENQQYPETIQSIAAAFVLPLLSATYCGLISSPWLCLARHRIGVEISLCLQTRPGACAHTLPTGNVYYDSGDYTGERGLTCERWWLISARCLDYSCAPAQPRTIDMPSLRHWAIKGFDITLTSRLRYLRAIQALHGSGVFWHAFCRIFGIPSRIDIHGVVILWQAVPICSPFREKKSAGWMAVFSEGREKTLTRRA